MKNLIAITGGMMLSFAIMLTATASPYPPYADMDGDGVVGAEEYQAYAFDRADTDDNQTIDPNERPRYERLLDLDQEL